MDMKKKVYKYVSATLAAALIAATPVTSYVNDKIFLLFGFCFH